jgi:hypothetical protein
VAGNRRIDASHVHQREDARRFRLAQAMRGDGVAGDAVPQSRCERSAQVFPILGDAQLLAGPTIGNRTHLHHFGAEFRRVDSRGRRRAEVGAGRQEEGAHLAEARTERRLRGLCTADPFVGAARNLAGEREIRPIFLRGCDHRRRSGASDLHAGSKVRATVGADPAAAP